MESVYRARQDSLPSKMHLNKQMNARGILGESLFMKNQYARGHNSMLIKNPQVSHGAARARAKQKKNQNKRNKIKR